VAKPYGRLSSIHINNDMAWRITDTLRYDAQQGRWRMVALGPTRRHVLAGAAATAATPLLARRPAPPLTVVLLGQSLIQEDLCRSVWPGRAALARLLGGADCVFTDLETALAGRAAAVPTRQGEVFHDAPPAVLDCLASLGVTMVTTANNHAWDLGAPGILHALRELDRRGITHAGSGATLDAASAPGIQATRAGRVALVAAAAGAIREGAAATALQPGVSELRRDAAGKLVEKDVLCTVGTIRRAKAAGATVIACLHNHYWETDPARTPDWQRALARRWIDAGASVFVGHGPTMLQEVELYRDAPLFHGLGSFIFQTRKPDGSYGPETWRSMLVEAVFEQGEFVRAVLRPIDLDPTCAPPNAGITRGVPVLLSGPPAAAACRRLLDQSRAVAAHLTDAGNSLILTAG
jgi:poly-gamma-glutamate synthesis protein (capsule biosynthesis protein)